MLTPTYSSLEYHGQVSTPCIDDHAFAAEDFVTIGALKNVAAKIVLKALYAASLARVDLLWTVNALARELTTWNLACDKRLHRLISYIDSTKNQVMCNYVGDKPEDCNLVLFCDASYAGCLRSSKSTSGCLLCLVGPRTFVVICWFCKKQTAISHSSTEAEVVAMDAGVRIEGLPAVALWSLIKKVFASGSARVTSRDPIPVPRQLGNGSSEGPGKPGTGSSSQGPWSRRKPTEAGPDSVHPLDFVPPSMPPHHDNVVMQIMEDNEAVIKMCLKGRSPALRHVGRTHRVDLDWLFDVLINDPALGVRYVGTKLQLADLLTKGSFPAPTWMNLMR